MASSIKINYYIGDMDYAFIIKDIKEKLDSAVDLTEILRLKVSLARYTHYVDREESLRIIRKLENEVQKVQDEFVRGWYWYNCGWHTYESGDFSQAAEEFLRAFDYFQLIGDESGPKGMASSLGGQANCSYAMGDYDNALPLMLRTVELADKIGDRRLSGATSQNIGAIYLRKKRFSEAREFLNLALRQLENHDEPYINQLIYLNMGVSYRDEGDFIRAHEWFEKINQLGLLDSSPHFHCEVLMEQGRSHLIEKQYDQARECVAKARRIGAEGAFSDLLRQLDRLEGEISFESGSYEMAREILLKAEEESEGPLESECYLLLSRIAEKSGQMKEALDYYKAYDKEKRRGEEEGPSNIYTETRIRLAEESRRRMELISGIGQTITANLTIEQIVEAVYDSLVELTRADIFGIGLIDDDGLTFPIFRNEGGTVPGFTIPRDSRASFAFWAVNNRRTIFINDLEKERENYVTGQYNPLPDAEKDNRDSTPVNSLIYVPLQYGENPIGVLTVQAYKKGNFSVSHINLLEALEPFVTIGLENARKTKELERLSGLDFLTGLANRRLLDEQFREISLISRRSGTPLSLLILDIDHFKLFNDNYGHDTGDRCLQHISALLQERLHRPLDKPGRFGGEEFIVILGECDEESGKAMAEKLRKAIETTPLKGESGPLPVTVSIGGVTFLGEDEKDLMASPHLKKADSALYKAKEAGRNRVCWD